MKRILETLKRKWPDYLLEVFVITIGILGAFMLSNWNDNRLNRKEEFRILSDLKREFLKNKQSAELKLSQNIKSTKGVYHLIELNGKGNLFDDLNLTDSLLAVAMSWGTFDAQTGVTNEIINAGKISLLRDSDLKNQLTGWGSQLMNAQEDYKARADHWVLVVMPYLGRYFNLLHLDNVEWGIQNLKNNVKPFKSTFQPNENMDPLEFENLIWTMKYHTDYVIFDEVALKEYIDETLSLIQRNLDN
jgi:hypothetical protein